MTPAGARVLVQARGPDAAVTASAGNAPACCRPPAEAVALEHHLRNVLSSIRAHAQLMLSAVGDAKTLVYLEVIEDASRSCCRQVGRECRPYAPSEAGDAPGADAGRAVKWVCDLACGEATLRGVELAGEAEGRLPPAAVSREDLERVLLELVRNAVRATRRHGRVDVSARTCRLSGGMPGVEIRVADTGQGIPECALTTIFEPFFTTRGPDEGLGLGLALAASLVGRAGASIDVETAEGAGTTFSVRVPAARADTSARAFGPPACGGRGS